jgi:dipeptidyl aminopeptidase/acylaminoacyl peptidase
VRQPAGKPAPEPPPSVFRLVKYDAPVGKLAAYLTPDPGDGQKHPGIVWITGGDCNTIDELWEPQPRRNDQTAAAYRKAGIVMMLPSLRGGNDNPGQREGFFGEVDDVLAAADYLAHQDYVDPKRIYLGGHSTGGTLVMLVAESSDRFRAAFAFGPVDDVRGYGGRFSPFDTSNPKEFELRAPVRWLNSVRSPLFVFEGTNPTSNLVALQRMARASTNPLIHFLVVKGVNHFSILAPTNELIAAKILRDDGPTTNIEFSEQELSGMGAR